MNPLQCLSPSCSKTQPNTRFEGDQDYKSGRLTYPPSSPPSKHPVRVHSHHFHSRQPTPLKPTRSSPDLLCNPSRPDGLTPPPFVDHNPSTVDHHGRPPFIVNLALPGLFTLFKIQL